MKLYSKIIQGCSQLAVCGMLILGMSACYDEKMEWGTDYRHPDFRDLPLELREKIDRYEALTAYLTRFNQNFKLGAGIDFRLYMNDDAYQKIVNENFKDVTAGNEMKQTALMDSRGNLNFKNADDAIAKLTGAGLGIYGHVLVWHQQQRAPFLNSLIAPTVIPGTPGSSLIVNGDFANGLSGWGIPYWSQNVSVTTVDGLNSMVVFVGENGGGKFDMQINSPTFPIIKDHRYEISFLIKSDVAGGQVGLDFPNNNLTNQYPWTEGRELTTTSTAWMKVTYNPTTTPDGMVATTDNPAMNFRLLLGAVKNVTYYITNVEVIDLDAEEEYNYVVNGNFETGELAPFIANNPNPNNGAITVTEEAKFEGTYGLRANADGSNGDYWALQLQIPEIILNPAKTYTMSFWIKSEGDGQGRISFPGFDNEWPWTNWDGSGAKEAFFTSSSWKQMSFDFTPVYKEGVNAVKFNFDLGKIKGMTYFLDDIRIVEKKEELKSKSTLRAGATEIPKTPEEKTQIIGDTLKWYITEVVNHFKGTVHAWEVVNEALNDNGDLRSSSGNDGPEEFYWQDYLGKDYAVIAFKAAAAADPDAKLFINDYSLESTNQTKLSKLIEYVDYIESQGARVDGIGTQMHLNINWSDTTGIKNMFEKLAATGKLIKVTELDIAIDPASGGNNPPSSPISPTLAQYAQQAELYRFVADMYYQIIPANQQYGITVWGITDNEKEHEYWLKNDAPNLWDAKHVRKHAYKGFADGLAGYDVGATFKQDDKWSGR